VAVVANLWEVYTATLSVPPLATDDEVEQLQAQCAARATAWLTMNGLDAELLPITVRDRVGVRWTITVGRGETSLPVRDYAMPYDSFHEVQTIEQGIAWTWSARWQHWLGWFTSMAKAEEAQRPTEHTELATWLGDRWPDMNGPPSDDAMDAAAAYQNPPVLPVDAVSDADLTEGQRDLVRMGLHGDIVPMLTDDHADGRQWVDKDGDVWTYDADQHDWLCMTDEQGDNGVRAWGFATPRERYGPFVQLSEAHEVDPPQ